MTGTGRVRDAGDLLLPEVRHTIQNLTLRPEDSAAATLAERYAASIDDAGDPATLKELGPKLLTTLVELGATPRARAAAGKPAGGGAGGKLAQLRASRSA